MKTIKFLAIGIIAAVFSLPLVSNSFSDDKIVNELSYECSEMSCTQMESCICTEGNSGNCEECCQKDNASASGLISKSEVESECCGKENCEQQTEKDCCK